MEFFQTVFELPTSFQFMWRWKNNWENKIVIGNLQTQNHSIGGAGSENNIAALGVTSWMLIEYSKHSSKFSISTSHAENMITFSQHVFSSYVSDFCVCAPSRSTFLSIYPFRRSLFCQFAGDVFAKHAARMWPMRLFFSLLRPRTPSLSDASVCVCAVRLFLINILTLFHDQSLLFPLGLSKK